MKLKKLGNNETEVQINDNTTVLFSYETPVAACVHGIYYKTDKKWSATTSKHINKWLGSVNADIMPQPDLDNLVKV